MKIKVYRIWAVIIVLLFIASSTSIAISTNAGIEDNSGNTNAESSNAADTNTASPETENGDDTSTEDSTPALSDTKTRDATMTESSSDISDNIHENARDKYNTATSEYQETSEVCEEAKLSWLTARARYRESGNPEELSAALEKANTYLVKAERKLLTHIDRIIVYVGGSDLDDTEKQNILDKLNSYTTWLERKQQEIEGATTKTELKDVAKTVRERWQEIKQYTKWITGQIMNEKINSLISKAEAAAVRIERKIQNLKEQGKDTAALEDWLENFYEKIDVAKEKYQAARDKYAEIGDLSDADSLRDAKALLLDAKHYLKNSYKTLREIVKELKRYQNREVTVSGTGTLIAEGDGSASIAGDVTIELSGEDVTLIITDNNGDMTITVTGFGDKTEIESNKCQYTGTGTATVTGSDVEVVLEGKNINLFAEGKGSATLAGEGSYSVYKRQLTDDSPVCIANEWNVEGAAISLSVEGG